MTRERAKEMLPIIEGFIAGKVIQYRNSNGEWVNDFYQTDIDFGHSSTAYRVKPEEITENSSECCGGKCGCGEN
jgi:hypothetical protein